MAQMITPNPPAHNGLGLHARGMCLVIDIVLNHMRSLKATPWESFPWWFLVFSIGGLWSGDFKLDVQGSSARGGFSSCTAVGLARIAGLAFEL